MFNMGKPMTQRKQTCTVYTVCTKRKEGDTQKPEQISQWISMEEGRKQYTMDAPVCSFTKTLQIAASTWPNKTFGSDDVLSPSSKRFCYILSVTNIHPGYFCGVLIDLVI